jgi:hypothetical protein
LLLRQARAPLRITAAGVSASGTAVWVVRRSRSRSRLIRKIGSSLRVNGNRVGSLRFARGAQRFAKFCFVFFWQNKKASTDGAKTELLLRFALQIYGFGRLAVGHVDSCKLISQLAQPTQTLPTKSCCGA